MVQHPLENLRAVVTTPLPSAEETESQGSVGGGGIRAGGEVTFSIKREENLNTAGEASIQTVCGAPRAESVVVNKT